MLNRDDDYLINKHLHKHLVTLSNGIANELKGDCIYINSPIGPPLDEILKRALEQVSNSNNKHLIVVLQTAGGSLEIAERLVHIMRNHYDEVSFIIPDYAMSAGTVLALSGDEIYMNYKSVLGSIDPQIRLRDGRFVPGLGIISEIERLKSASNDLENSNRNIDLQLLHKNYNLDDVFTVRQYIAYAESLIKKWMPIYKFKNWKKTLTRRKIVTKRMKTMRAARIAKRFGSPKLHFTHSRGIPMEKLMEKEFDLQIIDYGAKEYSKLNEHVTDYHEAIMYYLELLNTRYCVHTGQKLWRI